MACTVAIVGGTHGNEMVGINEARELASELKDASVVFDLHNTTSCSGTMIIIGSDTDALTLQYCAGLVARQPARRVWLNVPTKHGARATHNVGSVAKCDIGLELGPLAHGLCRADLFATAQAVLHDCLDLSAQLLPAGGSAAATTLEVYRWSGELVPFPTDPGTGHVTAMVAPSLQDADWQPLNKGDPVFITFGGQVVRWEGDTVYPVFVNEVAYCAPPPLGNNAKVAFFPCSKEVLDVPAM